jgi:hypothetical protein
VDGFLLVFDLEGTLVERVPDLGARHRRRAALNSPGLDWTRKYPAIAAGVASLGARPAHLDGELCSFLPDGITSSGLIQAVPDAIDPAGLEYFIFELLHLDGEDLCPRPLIERKARPAALLPRCRTAPCRERRWPRLGRSLTRFLAVFGLAGLRHCDRNRLLAAFHLPARPLRRVHKNCFFCGVPMVRIHLPPSASRWSWHPGAVGKEPRTVWWLGPPRL